jgi:GWxTD domain-containing protein
VLAILLAVAALQDPAVRAESLLAAGRAHFARPVVGRYAALEAFRAAARLVPADPEPLYWQMKVGFYLGMDEGEVMARNALLALFAIVPDYKDAWERFEQLYHNAGIWRRADRALAHHPTDPVALERRAQLAIALGEPRRADSLAARALSLRPSSVAAYTLRAEAHFIAGEDSLGQAWYDSALVHADADSAGVLWAGTWMIASPEETARYAATASPERRGYFEAFWAQRDANLLTRANERLAEHFRRFVYARRYYRLLHPQSLYFRSDRARGLSSMDMRDSLAQLASATPEAFVSPTARVFAAHRLAPDPRSVDDTAGGRKPVPVQMYASGFDARGLAYLRQGAPDLVVRGQCDALVPVNGPCTESWLYRTVDGPLTIAFVPSSGGGSQFGPINARQVQATRRIMRTDRSALPAGLRARAWTAFFKSAELGRTDVYYRAQTGAVAAALWDSTGHEVGRTVGRDLVTLRVTPGRYRYGVDIDSSGVLGRGRGAVTVPDFVGTVFALSSLVLAPGDTLLDRDAALRGMPATLAYPAATPLSTYVEVYGLTADPEGRSQYRVRYSFAPIRWAALRLLGGGRPVVFEFDRDVWRGGGGARERLVITPGELPPGRYRVTVAVTDLRRNVKSESVVLEVTIR